MHRVGLTRGRQAGGAEPTPRVCQHIPTDPDFGPVRGGVSVGWSAALDLGGCGGVLVARSDGTDRGYRWDLSSSLDNKVMESAPPDHLPCMLVLAHAHILIHCLIFDMEVGTRF